MIINLPKWELKFWNQSRGLTAINNRLRTANSGYTNSLICMKDNDGHKMIALNNFNYHWDRFFKSPYQIRHAFKKTLGISITVWFQIGIKNCIFPKVLDKTPWISPPRNLKCKDVWKYVWIFLHTWNCIRNINTFSMFTVQTNNRHQLCLILFKSFLLRAKFD